MRAKQITATIFATLHAVNGTPTPSQFPSSSPQDLALRMLKSIEERGQATLDAGGSTGYIQLALFWQALAVVTTPDSESKANEDAVAALRPLLETSLASTIPAFANVTKDVEISLDRLSLGAEMIAWTLHKDQDPNDNATTQFLPTISNLATSLSLQPQNANGDYWYYNNVANLTAYRNLTYLDGMYSLAPFMTILPQLERSSENNSSIPGNPVEALESALRALQSLHAKCAKPSGLLVHGYDAIKSHAWAANNTNGASPEVWSRSLGWYSLGLLNTLEIAARNPEQLESEAYETLRKLFQAVMRAQVLAVERSKLVTGMPGVWQVVDAPGEEGNFVEASGSLMTVYTLLRGIRLNFLANDINTTVIGEDADQDCTETESSSIVDLAKEIYGTVSDLYLISHANGSLSLNGTSSVSSLSPQGVGYEYYVTRPREVDSLIGTSAFALASWEVGRVL
jgi:rhamnogalacturonyl hydrolase YesR